MLILFLLFLYSHLCITQSHGTTTPNTTRLPKNLSPVEKLVDRKNRPLALPSFAPLTRPNQSHPWLYPRIPTPRPFNSTQVPSGLQEARQGSASTGVAQNSCSKAYGDGVADIPTKYFRSRCSKRLLALKADTGR